MDKVKGGDRKDKVERIMSVEKRHVFINTKAISIKMLVLSRKGGRKGESQTGG